MHHRGSPSPPCEPSANSYLGRTPKRVWQILPVRCAKRIVRCAATATNMHGTPSRGSAAPLAHATTSGDYVPLNFPQNGADLDRRLCEMLYIHKSSGKPPFRHLLVYTTHPSPPPPSMMLHIAVTAPVNPPSASPVLTHAQCWAGLQEKCRRPQDFIAPVTACEVLEERPDGMTRRITHKNWMGMPSGQATQTIDFSGNLKVRAH